MIAFKEQMQDNSRAMTSWNQDGAQGIRLCRRTSLANERRVPRRSRIINQGSKEWIEKKEPNRTKSHEGGNQSPDGISLLHTNIEFKHEISVQTDRNMTFGLGRKA